MFPPISRLVQRLSRLESVLAVMWYLLLATGTGDTGIFSGSFVGGWAPVWLGGKLVYGAVVYEKGFPWGFEYSRSG